MKTAQQAATKYGTNGSAPAATQLWAQNFNAEYLNMLAAATAAIPTWQAAVADPQSAVNMSKGLTKAKAKQASVATKVTNTSSASLAAGVRAASTGAYLAFSNQWLPAVAQEVQTLNQTNPRGTRAQNRARQAAYDAWVDQQNGNFRQ
jgi:hypothetical protein